MTQLFGRKAVVKVSTITLTYPGLDFEFSVEKSTATSPNKAEIKIFNLNPTHRLFLTTLNQVPCQIEAGYDKAMPVIFLGNLRTVVNKQDGANIETTIGAGDGEQAYREGRAQLTVPKGTTVEDVAKYLAQAMKLGQGNIPDAFKQLSLISGQKLPKSMTLRGNAAREMTALCKSVGATWSIQNGKIQVLRRGVPAKQTAVKLTETSGLIESPSRNSKGLVQCKCLIQPDLDPGHKFVLESAHLKGQFIVQTAKYTGKTYDKDWYIEIEGKAY